MDSAVSPLIPLITPNTMSAYQGVRTITLLEHPSVPECPLTFTVERSGRTRIPAIYPLPIERNLKKKRKLVQENFQLAANSTAKSGVDGAGAYSLELQLGFLTTLSLVLVT